MQLNNNLSLNRFEWAVLKAKSLIKQYYNEHTAVYYDIGAGKYLLAKQIESEAKICYSFDLLPFSADVQQWDVEQVFPYNYPKASIVTFLEIVEHLNNPWLSLKNISAAMEPGGFLILTTPNPKWSTCRINLLLKGFLNCFTPDDLELNHHVFTPWPHIIEKLLNDNGFTIAEYVTLDGNTKIFGADIKLSSLLLQIPARIIKKIIEHFDPASKGMSYGIIARKTGETT
jgi:hypothetical protein